MAKRTLFIADDGIHGPALWISDGTEAGTRLLKDIAPGFDDPQINLNGFLSLADGRVIFRANDRVHGAELWITDGTTAGTFMVKDILPGLGGSTPIPIGALGSKAILMVHTTDGSTLWVTDGTENGTAQLIDLDPNSNASFGAHSVAIAGDKLFFSTGTNGGEVWVTDGTPAGTVQIPWQQSGGSATGPFGPTQLTAVGNKVVFTASSAGEGHELWVSDGTAAGTMLLKDIRAGSGSSNASELARLGDRVLFRADDGVNGSELWVTDGTSEGTLLLKDIWGGAVGSSPNGFFLFDGELLFHAAGDLWATDGTEAGTRLVSDVSPSFIGSFAPVVLGGNLIFAGATSAEGTEIWSTDGTTAGTILLKDIRAGNGSSSPQFMTLVGDKVLFMANDNVVGNEPWVTDGTPEGTMLLKDIRPGNGFSSIDPDFFAAMGSLALFDAADPTEGFELFVTDGTPAGTAVIDIADERTAASTPQSLFALGGQLHFIARDTLNGNLIWVRPDGASDPQPVAPDLDDPLIVGEAATIGNKRIFFAAPGTGNAEPWVTDGTAAGTFMLKDIYIGHSGSVNQGTQMLVLGSKAIFPALNFENGKELWVTDGTAAGTVMLRDIWAGANSSNPVLATVLGSRILFTATDSANGWELWATDGTGAGTVMLRNINPGTADSSPRHFYVVGGTAYFNAVTAANGYELWKTDGTAAGTVLVRDIASGTASSDPTPIGSVAGKLLFTANVTAGRGELWISDGSSAGTTLLKSFISDGAGTLFIRGIEAGGKYYFGAEEAESGVELWVTDGTAGGTQRLSDISPGAADALAGGFVALGDKIVFISDGGPLGRELYVTDGTAEGTVLLKDIRAGAPGSSPGFLTVFGDKLIFVANDGVNGAELWVSDGTPEGTMLLKDIYAGSQGSSISSFATGSFEIRAFFEHDGKLYFRANDGAHGAELWETDGTAAGTRMVKDLNTLQIGSAPRNYFVADFNDASVAQPDAVSTAEDTIGTGDLFADNGYGADSNAQGDTLTISHVNGSAANVGVAITLASGAKLTVNADGSYSYDPNGKFNWLTDNRSGAVNTSATDSFDYTLAGGNTVTVTVTVNGVAGPGDQLMGDGTENVITGTPQGDTFLLHEGGADEASGAGGRDVFYFGAAFARGDQVDGGGNADIVILQGDYSAGTSLNGIANLGNLGSISLFSHTNTLYGGQDGTPNSYNLTSVDSNVGAGEILKINGTGLASGENLTFDGSAETDGTFWFYGGKGTDTLIGGAKQDVFIFGPEGRFAAGDSIDGGDGYDLMVLRGDYVLNLLDPAYAGAFTGIESIALISAADKTYGSGGGTNFYYLITWGDALLGAGATMTVNGSRLGATETVYFEGSDESDGHFRLFGGAADDFIAGGNGNDLIYGGRGADRLAGRGGIDVFRYQSTDESTATSTDTISDFETGIDKIDLSRIDANVHAAGDQAFTFIGTGAFSGTGAASAGQLRLVATGAGAWRVEGDTDGDGVADLVIDFETTPLVAPGDFNF